TGDWFLFVDADSYLHAATLAELLRVIRRGRYAGGGCRVGLDETPRGGGLLVAVWNTISRLLEWAAGSVVFCRADAFHEIGGFSTELYAAEEIEFSRQLKRWARRNALQVVILNKHPHISSGRKFRLYSRTEILAHGLRGLTRPGVLRDRTRLGYFYDG